MAIIPEDLKRVKNEVDGGKKPQATVRTLLAWFGQQRRGSHVVRGIRSALRRCDLATVPDFDSVWIDETITFEKAPSKMVTSAAPAAVPTVTESPPVPNSTPAPPADPSPARVLQGHDPAYSVRKLAAAHRTPVSVKPDTTISEAVTIMLAKDFSQLPVMQSERVVKGLVSWKSIGSRLALRQPCDRVSDAMEQVKTVSAEASIFQVADILASDEVVLVQASRSDTKITGILTTTDLTEQFGRLGEPFLLIGEIENRLRVFIDGKFSLQELEKVRNPNDPDRQIDSVLDLTFGEYAWLLQDPDGWSKCKLPIDRKVFCAHLDNVRMIRNDVMHFDTEDVGPEAMNDLRLFAKLLEKLGALSLR